MKLKNILLLSLSLVAVAAIAVAGTLAYLTSTNSDVNVMTLGNVEIDQLEYERVVDDNGEWESLGTTDKYGYTPDKVQEFIQAKPLFPAVFSDGDIKWDDRNGSQAASGTGSHQQSWGQIGAPGSNQLFDGSVKNVIDKFVFVKNTGKSDAYVRTWFAFEQGDIAADNFKNVIMTNTDVDHWSWETIATDVEIEGNTYYVMCATYLGPQSNPTCVLKPGETTYASLLQVYMRPEATNEDVEAIDGNKNGAYDILVFSQAIQTAGFEPSDFTTFSTESVELLAATAALNEGFTEDHPWVEGEGADIPVVVDSVQELKDAMLIRGAKIVLGNDIVIEKDTPLQWGAYMFVANGREVTIDLNGKNITVEEDASLKCNGLFTTANAGTLNIVGNGTVEIKNGQSGIFHAMNPGDKINVYDGTYISNSNNDSDALAIIYTNRGTVDVYGGTFVTLEGIPVANAEDIQGNKLFTVFHEGTILKYSMYYTGYDATRIQLAESCTLKEVTIEGESWYKVVAE